MSTLTISSKKNYAKYDLLKFFLSLMIIAIHSAIYPMILYPWLRIAVPLFFIMSSYFVFSKLCSATPDKQKSIIKKFVVRNLQLYFCWLAIFLPITLYYRKREYFSHGLLGNIWAIIKSFLFGDTFPASWFIISTIIGVLIIYYLNKLLRKDYIVFIISLLVFFVVTLSSSYTSILKDTFLLTAINKYSALFGKLACSFPASLFWVFIGKIFAEKKVIIKSAKLLILLIICNCIALFIEWRFVISLDGSYNNDSYFMLAPLCVLLFSGLQKLKPLYWEHSVYFKHASTVIYVTHYTLLPIVIKLISVIFNAKIPILAFFITFLSCITIYIFIEIAVKKCRIIWINKFLNMLY